MIPTNEFKNYGKKIWKKWSLAVSVLPLVILITGVKYVAHVFNWELMELNALFTSLVAGTIFLIGFLISGVLADYKESEKLPSDLAASLRNILDDTITIYKNKESERALTFLNYQKELSSSLLNWFYKKEKTLDILKLLSKMNNYFIEFENESIQANYIIRLKNEQNNIRRMVMRIDTIRDTQFIGSAYTIVEIMAFMIALGLVIMKLEPFYASFFFTLIVTFLITYMLFLIKDLDNPFDYALQGETGTEISLKPLYEADGYINSFKFNN